MDRMLLNATETGKWINVIYMANDQSISKRTIKIYKCTDTYIYAYCMMRQNVRRFNIDNILASQLHNKILQ